ncbi:MAG: hypothetical protein K5892_00230 [Acholeplasmatales bacterium]|nr:hypothetical protein [Acholeplasmatales bacterium]
MEVDFDKGVISIYGKQQKISSLVRSLASLSGNQVYYFFMNREIKIPKVLNVMSLQAVLNKKIKFLNSESLSKDYFKKLEYYRYFTEYQLYDLFMKIANDPVSFKEYREALFYVIIYNYLKLNLNDGELTYLKNLRKAKTESFSEYFDYVSACSLELDDTFDGVSIADLEFNLANTASKEMMQTIAGRHGIELPSVLTIDEYLEYITYSLRMQGAYNDAIVDELKNMSIEQLESYCDRVGIKMKSHLNEKMMSDYLIYILGQVSLETTPIDKIYCSEEYIPLEFSIDYDALNDLSVTKGRVIHYEGEDEDTDAFLESIKEEPKEEPVEIIPEPIDEPITEEEIVEEAPIISKSIQTSIDDENLADDEALSDEEILKLVQKEEKKEEIIEKKIDIDVANVISNDKYKSYEFEKLRGKNKTTLIIAILTIFLVVVLSVGLIIILR